MTDHGVEVNGGKAHGFLLPGGAVGHEMWYGGNKIFPMGLAEGTVLWTGYDYSGNGLDKTGTIFVGDLESRSFDMSKLYSGVTYNIGNTITLSHSLNEIGGGLQFEFSQYATDAPYITFLLNSTYNYYYNYSSQGGTSLLGYSDYQQSELISGKNYVDIKVRIPKETLMAGGFTTLMDSKDYLTGSSVKSPGKLMASCSGDTVKLICTVMNFEGSAETGMLAEDAMSELYPLFRQITAY